MSDDLGRGPTRRSLREQRRAGEAADKARDLDPSAHEQSAPAAESNASDDTNQLDRVSKANRSRRAADVPFDMVPERAERGSLQRARDREALRAQRAAEAQRASAAPVAPVERPAGEDPAPLTRRQLRLQALAAARAAQTAPATEDQDETAGTGRDEAAGQEASGSQLSVEEALEARRQGVAAQPERQPTIDDGDDLEVVARQRELAARAAVISRRVAERERIRQSTTERKQQTADPFTGAMNRLRHEQAERDLANTGINAPQTSGFQLEMPATVERPRVASRPVSPEADSPTPAIGSPAGTTGWTSSRDPEAEGGEPVSARSALGLDPLDYLTAGVRRVNTWTLAVVAALVVGAGALVTGIILISTK
ncbi:hypothetical protein [Arthrobacter sp.]|uniref:hypothetical protein n=1 Tax=Arthrobacter sp. TaxID=1667 RepID=UPI003A93E9C9